MPEKPDIRYVDPVGAEVEAYQITDSSRYQNQLWPEWLSPRDFITIDGEAWLDLDGKEVKIPPYGWIVWNGVEKVVVGAMAFEAYDKVVKEPTMIDLVQAKPEQAPMVGPGAADFAELMLELQVALEVGLIDSGDGMDALKKVITKRVTWCTCAPGQCEEGDRWSCRKESPLTQ